MPIYQYRCESCDHELEALQKMSDAALTECPHCGKDSLKKQLTAAAFRLKGSGWYETDFKNSGSKKKPETKDGSDKKKTGTKKSSTTVSGSDSKSKSATS